MRIFPFGTCAFLLAAGGCGGDGSPTDPADPGTPNVPASITISGMPSSVVVGDTLQLSSTVRNAGGAVMSGASVTWSSLDAGRLQALAAGRFVAIGSGDARIVARAGEVADTAVVDAEARRLTTLLARTTGSFFVTGDQEAAAVEARDQRGRAMDPPALVWSSSDPATVAVSDDGEVDALAPGEAEITVRSADDPDGGPSAAFTISVVPGDGPRVPELARVDSVVATWMAANNVPGAQVAVMHEGRLVFSRAYGVRDAEATHPVTEDALFRIGSLSKPIAGLAFLQLLDQGVVSLDDRPFEALLGTYEPVQGATVDPRLAQATARQILRHQTGYGDREVDNVVYRGVWQHGALQATEHFRHGLGHPLDHDPGTQHVYTNYNTQAIARYIELRVGRSFEAHVRDVLMAPAGVTRMVFGKGPIAERDPMEVRYHGADGQPTQNIDQNPFPMPYYEASGSWIGTAGDLMRIMRGVEGSGGDPPLVSQASLDQIATRDPAVSGTGNAFYGLQWGVTLQGGHVAWWHTGAAQGAWARLYRSSDGTSYAVLVNRESAGGQLSLSLAPLLSGMSWPEHDLFDR